MRDTTDILSTAVFDALNGHVVYNGTNIPVYDEKKKQGASADVYILFGTQQETNENTFETFMTNSILDIEICHKTGSEVSKKTLSGVANEILKILFPTPQTEGITSPSGFEIQCFAFAGSITRAFEISPNRKHSKKIYKSKRNNCSTILKTNKVKCQFLQLNKENSYPSHYPLTMFFIRMWCV
jgi:hypothetical protein